MKALASKVNMGSAHASSVTGGGHGAAPHTKGGAIQGFGGSKPHGSVLAGQAGEACHSPGTSVKGFSGGIKPGKV